jgi:16S rRNA G966 N2-methylase RsmD
LAMMGYDPSTDEVTDLFAGSGAVAFAADGMLV